MDKQPLKQLRLIDKIQQNILDNTSVKNKAFAIELARKWVKRA